MTSILVTNDDGIHSQGLLSLSKALEKVGDVTVVAPDREKSAASHALTLHRPLRVNLLRDGFHMVNGTPADCVYLGAIEILDRKPDLLVSGINRGANVGDDVTYSGTIAAAFEGTILGIPSFAISLVGNRRFDFTNASRVAVTMAEKILDTGLPKDILLNVNVPSGDLKGFRYTRQGKHIYEELVHEGVDPRGGKYYWIGSGEAPHVDQGEDTDYMAVRDGYVSICPLHLDLTHYESLSSLRQDWEGSLDGLLAVEDSP
jgi:5'-nucleotidase